MSKRQDRLSTADRLANQIAVGEAIAPIFENDRLKEFFRSYEKTRVKDMLEADPVDDEKRRSIALEINAMRALVVEMKQLVATGLTARRKLEEMTQDA